MMAAAKVPVSPVSVQTVDALVLYEALSSAMPGQSASPALALEANGDDRAATHLALMRQQLAQNRLVEQVKRDDSEAPLTDTWDSRQADTAIDHVRAFEYKHAGVPTTKKPKRAEPTVRLRKAMGLPLRKNEPLFDKDFPKTLPIK